MPAPPKDADRSVRTTIECETGPAPWMRCGAFFVGILLTTSIRRWTNDTSGAGGCWNGGRAGAVGGIRGRRSGADWGADVYATRWVHDRAGCGAGGGGAADRGGLR